MRDRKSLVGSKAPQHGRSIGCLQDGTFAADELVALFRDDASALDAVQQMTGGISQRVERVTRGMETIGANSHRPIMPQNLADRGDGSTVA
jgi:hypothetical protein